MSKPKPDPEFRGIPEPAENAALLKRIRMAASKDPRRVPDASASLIRGCLGKSRYATSEEATAGARRNEAVRGGRLGTYACTSCGGFHLTKNVR